MTVDLDKIRAALDAATQGEWRYRPCEYDGWGEVRGPIPGTTRRCAA